MENEPKDSRRIALVIGILALLAGAAADAAKLPPALSEESTVCEWSEYSMGGTSAAAHPHEGLKRWHLKKGKTKITIDRKLLGERLHYFDKKWAWFNEIQDPGLYVVNSHANTMWSDPTYPDYKCPPPNKDSPNPDALSIFKSAPFVFAFGIHKIENNKGSAEKKSPHMLVYLPLRTDASSKSTDAQEFQILLFHMNEKEGDCPANQHAVQCKALVNLRDMWEDELNTPHEIVEATRTAINDILEFAKLDENEKKRRKDAGQIFGDGDVYEANHNGVIHGVNF